MAEPKSEEQLDGYDARWDRRLQKIQRCIAAGETDLGRVVAAMETPRREVLDAKEEFWWMGRVVTANPAVMSAQMQAIIYGTLQQLAEPATEYVVDVGSGDGLKLFSWWCRGGPRLARYLALEVTTVGRRCTEALAELEPGMAVEAHHFDYNAPDYSMIPDGLANLVVYTSGSVEQIAQLPESAITQLLDKAKHVACAQFEPIGWQIKRRLDRRGRAHRERCLRKGYNENLWALLSQLEAEGRITIERVVVDAFGKASHPASIVVWRKTA